MDCKCLWCTFVGTALAVLVRCPPSDELEAMPLWVCRGGGDSVGQGHQWELPLRSGAIPLHGDFDRLRVGRD